LDVAGDIKFTGTLFVGAGVTGSSGQVLSSDGAGSLAWITAGGTYYGNNGVSMVGTSLGLGGTLSQNTQIGTSNFFLSFTGLGGTQSLFVSSTGNVGIGMTNPIQKFVLAGGIGTTAPKAGYFSTDNMLLSSLDGGAYFGRVGLKENQWGLNNFGATWTSKGTAQNWNSVAMSSDGKIQTMGVGTSGLVWVSYDYGATWASKASAQNWNSVAMSSDGRIQTMGVGTSGLVWISSDYGATWTSKATAQNWNSAAMSSDGKVQTMGVGTSGNIWVSYDYGVTWASKGSAQNWNSVAMSSDGKIQTMGVGVSGLVWVSYDYGVTWTSKATAQNWTSVAMSSDGRVQTMGVGTTGNLWVSYDYGATWISKATAQNWSSVAMSSDGKIQTAVVYGGLIWESIDYGLTWNSKASALNWGAIAMSSDGKLQTAAVEAGGNIWISATDSYIFGSVGIGTTNPGYKLEVVGDAMFSSKLGIGATGTRAFNVTTDASIGTNLSVGGSLVLTSLPVGVGTSVLYIASNGTVTKGLLSVGVNSKVITLSPEYPGASLGADGSGTTAVSITSDNTLNAGGVGWKNYYELSSTQAALQDYTVVVRVTLPADFGSWETGSCPGSTCAMEVAYQTGLGTVADNAVSYIVSNDIDVPGTAVCTVGTTASATWGSNGCTSAVLNDGIAPQWNAAGETAVIRIKMAAKNTSSAITRIGDIILRYRSTF